MAQTGPMHLLPPNSRSGVITIKQQGSTAVPVSRFVLLMALADVTALHGTQKHTSCASSGNPMSCNISMQALQCAHPYLERSTCECNSSEQRQNSLSRLPNVNSFKQPSSVLCRPSLLEVQHNLLISPSVKACTSTICSQSVCAGRRLQRLMHQWKMSRQQRCRPCRYGSRCMASEPAWRLPCSTMQHWSPTCNCPQMSCASTLPSGVSLV